jgi:hypothetical protein
MEDVHDDVLKELAVYYVQNAVKFPNLYLGPDDYKADVIYGDGVWTVSVWTDDADGARQDYTNPNAAAVALAKLWIAEDRGE